MNYAECAPSGTVSKSMARLVTFLLTMVLSLSFALGQAHAAAKTLAVMPFELNGPQGYTYLGKAIPSTLANRMVWPGQVELTTKSLPSKAPTSTAEVQKAQKSAGADYAVWGSINILQDQATIEARVRDKGGKEWTRSTQTSVGNLIVSVQALADDLSRQVFGRSISGTPSVNQMNPGIVVNETGQEHVYLNPQFRYQGSGADDGSRLRSVALSYDMVDFTVGDFSGSGNTQIAILADHKLYIYDWNGGKMKQLVEHTIAMASQAFILRKVHLNRGRPPQLVVTTFSESDNQPASYIYTFEGGTLREYAKRTAFFLNVVPLAPTYTPTLVAQRWDSVNLFRPGVYMASVVGDTVTMGGKLGLPKGANVFNFAYLPPSNKESEKIVVLNRDSERLKVFSRSGEALHETTDSYSGSAVGMEHYKSIDGLGVDRRYQLPSKYYAPMRMNVVDLEGRGEYTLLINKPVSTAAEIFDSYRFFPQGEVHALYWDGIGLGLKWKTRRIRGSVVDVDLGDINNDGIIDLVVGLNTHPGAMGVGSRKAVITAYPLDVSLTNPHIPADMSDFESNR